MKPKDFEVNILYQIALIQRRYPDLIRPVVEVHEEYRLLRSFRRNSNSEAQNRRVCDGDIDHNNRWRKVERVGARKPKLRMREYYIYVLVSLESSLRHS